MKAFFFALSATLLLLVSANPIEQDSNSTTKGDLKCAHFRFGSYDYVYVSGNSLTFGQSVQYCEAKGGYLASINSHAENEYIRARIGNGNAWIGYYKDATVIDRWNSIDGTGGYTNWNTHEPNNYHGRENCCKFYGSIGKWNDIDCSARLPPLCKRLTPVHW